MPPLIWLRTHALQLAQQVTAQPARGAVPRLPGGSRASSERLAILSTLSGIGARRGPAAIPFASQRGLGQDLATHLMNAHDNQHMELVQVRGAVAQDLHGAFAESVNPDPGTGSSAGS
jgi:hypothetical protein